MILPEINLALIVSIAASVFAGIGWLVRISVKLGQLEMKVETMWGFQMRRSFSEVVSSGIGKIGSPLKFDIATQEALAPLRSQLISFWASLPKPISDSDALLKIEAAFGDLLLTQVCIPCQLSHGACLLLALTIAKEDNKVTLAPTIPPVIIDTPQLKEDWPADRQN